jgi:undecaprenyl diphosphate synthase
VLMEENVRLRIIGDVSGLPENAQRDLAGAVEKTSKNTGKVLCTALNYGARDELVRGMRKIARKVKAGQLAPERIGEETVEEHLDTAGMPPVDLLIRTSGEMRVSDFLLWQIAYAELYVTKTLWPDFRGRHFRKALAEYARRERRFGGVRG